MLPDLPPVPRVDINSLNLGLASESSIQQLRQLLPVDRNWHVRWYLFIIPTLAILVYFFLSIPFHFFFAPNDVPVSVPSLIWWIFKAYPLTFCFFFSFMCIFDVHIYIYYVDIYIFSPVEFTELKSVIVIPKSACRAKSQIKYEF